MKKKLIGLSILLLVLLLGLSTTSYALTKNEYKNIMYNYLTKQLNYTDSNAQTKIESYNITSTMDNYFNNDNYGFVALLISGTSQDLYIVVINKNGYNGNNSSYCVYYSGGRFWFPRSLCIRTIKVATNGTYAEYNENFNLSNTGLNYFGTELNIYTSGGVVQYPAGTWAGRLSIDGPYLDDYFVYNYNPDLTDIQVANIYAPNELTTIKSMTYNDFVGEYVAVVGMLKYLDYIQVTQAYWDNSISDWKLYRNNDNYITNNDFESTDPIEVKCPNGWWVGNTIIKFTCYPTWGNNVGDILEFWVYLVDNNTIINNGVLQIGTFSGDYNNNMQNDLNNQLADERTQEIINTITDDSQVDNILNEFSSGDYNDLAAKFGFRIFGQEYFDFIRDTVTDIVHVLEESEDVYFDYSMHGETPTRIYASDFTTPPGALKTFLSTFLVACTVYAFYKYMADLLELLSTGNIETALQEFKVDRNIFKM